MCITPTKWGNKKFTKQHVLLHCTQHGFDSFSAFQYIQFPLGTVPSLPVTIGITVNFMFHNFLSSMAKA